MLRGETIIDVDSEESRRSELHPEFAMRLRAARDPSSAVQIDQHRMRPVALRHRDISGEAGTNLNRVMHRADFGRILIHHRRERIHSSAQSLDVGRNGRLCERVEKRTFLVVQHYCLRSDEN